MRIAFVVAANKFTGAAAVAELCCRALHRAGHRALLLFTGGNNLEERLEGEPWAAPALVKERGPTQVRRNLRSLRRAAEEADVVVSHLPHDHLLCLLACVRRRAAMVRSFRSADHLGGDPYSRLLHRGVKAALAAHCEMKPTIERRLGAVPCLALPVPLEDRFAPGSDPRLWRRRLAIPEDVRVVGAIGKLARGRGFELLIDAAARIAAPAHVLVIGHGEAQDELQERAERHGIGERLHWAGYQERALPALYAAMDLVLFLSRGSDHGHRAISEAQACARPVVAVDIPGVADLVNDGVTGRVVPADPDAVAAAASSLLADPMSAERLGLAGAEAAAPRRLQPSGHRLAEFMAGVVSSLSAHRTPEAC